jgi:hypothetical protein
MFEHVTTRFRQSMLALSLCLVFPLNCLMHCALHPASDRQKNLYVCTMAKYTADESSENVQSASHPQRTVLEAVPSATDFNIHSVTRSRLRSAVAVLQTLYVSPDTPPPRV